MLLNTLNFCKSTIFFGKNENLFKFTKRKCNWSRLHPIHAKAMNGFYAPFYKNIAKPTPTPSTIKTPIAILAARLKPFLS